MRLKPVMLKKVVSTTPITQPKTETTKPVSKLPKDTYKPVLEQTYELQIADDYKLVFSASRMGDMGTPHVDIRLHVRSDQYTGPTKKGINFDVELFDEFMDIMNKLNDALAKKGV